jgi:hypothetical protein
MDDLILRLQQAGIIKVITEEEAANADYDIIIVPDEHSLSDPAERFAEGERVLQSWRDKLPKLPNPGLSLC